MKPLSLYIHIPFCKRKCSYCDFVSVAKPFSFQASYIDALIDEMKLQCEISSSHKIDTIYIGGGTPSFLDESLIEKLLSAVSDNFCTDHLREYTFECNPESVTPQKLEILKKHGVNRLSFGLQTTDRSELELLRRSHDFETFVHSFKLARDHGFKNISVDLMFALPSQTMSSLSKSLEDIISISPEHISCYSLIIEEATLMNKWVNEGKVAQVDDDTYVEMYRYIVSCLEKHGYRQYEISNFCKGGYESLHNSAYWLRQNYLGLGVAAHSMIDNKRFSNTDNITNYISCLDIANLPLKEGSLELLSANDIINENIFLGLRMNRGIKIKELPLEALDKVDGLVKNNLVEIEKDMIKLTQKGREISNTIFVELITD